MDTQFTDLSPVSESESYLCYNDVRSTGFTYLMKLVLSVEKFPESLDLIRDLCLNNSAEINKVNEKGFTALMLACVNSANYISNNKCVKILIDNGADTNIVANCRSTALLLSWIHYRQVGNTHAKSNIETIKLLLDAGADLNYSMGETYTIFSNICEFNFGKTELVNLCLNYRPNVNAQNWHGKPILSGVCMWNKNYSNNDIILPLIKNGADINMKSNSGYTPLIYACNYKVCGNVENIDILINYGANSDLQDNNGWTALMHFIYYGKLVERDIPTLMHLIIKSKNSILFTNSNGKTSYDLYIDKGYNLLDDFYLKILQGITVINNTKSANNF